MSGNGRAADRSAARPAASTPFPDDAAPLYTVGQVADMLGVQPAFLRRIDSEQVVMPSRSAGGQRRYSRQDIDHIHAVNGLLAEGFTLAGTKRILELQSEVTELRRELSVLSARRRTSGGGTSGGGTSNPP